MYQSVCHQVLGEMLHDHIISICKIGFLNIYSLATK